MHDVAEEVGREPKSFPGSFTFTCWRSQVHPIQLLVYNCRSWNGYCRSELSMAGKGQTTIKRLLHELQSYESEPSEALLHLGPVEDNELTHWRAVLRGVSGTAYEGMLVSFLCCSFLPAGFPHLPSSANTSLPGGLWALDIQIPPTYPHSPPTIKFLTPICHPNVHFKTGEICLDLLKTSWSPVYTIAETLNAIQQLLTSAEPDSPLNIDVAQLFRQGDMVGAEALIRFYTETERWEGW